MPVNSHMLWEVQSTPFVVGQQTLDHLLRRDHPKHQCKRKKGLLDTNSVCRPRFPGLGRARHLRVEDLSRRRRPHVRMARHFLR